MVSRGRPTLPQRHSKEAARAASPVAASGTAPSDASAQHSQHAHQACDVPQACLEASARKIQQHWMAFKAKHRPTAALVQAFIATGIPFSVALPPCPEGYDPTNDLRNEERVSMLRVLRPAPSSPTPLSTPEPCSSPTSTLRTLRGVGDGREAPSNTPAGGTPTDTPRAGAEGVQRGQAVEAAQAVQIPPMVGDHAMLHASRPRSESTQGMGDMGNRAVGHGGMQTGVAPRPLFLHSATPKREGAASFDEFAAAMSAPASLRAAQALLRRLHARAAAAGKLTPGCERLLQSLTPGSAKTGKVLDRYPVRAFLCSYMILGHPEVVLSHRGQREGALSSAAADMLAVFETLLQRLEPDNLRPGAQQDQHLMHGGYPGSKSVPQLLEVFDLCWVAYLEQFLAWKSHDAAGLEADLIRAAVELETSRLAKMAAAAARVRSQKDLDVSPLMLVFLHQILPKLFPKKHNT